MGREVRTKKKNRLWYMILSVIIAIIAWVLVIYTTNPDITKTFAGIPVEITGAEALAENGYVVVNRDDIPKTTIKLRGKRSDLMKALDRTKVIVDVSDISKSGEYEIEATAKLPNTRIVVEKLGTQSAFVVVEKVQTKDVPIRVIQTGRLDSKIVKSTPQSETLKIHGAASELELVTGVEVIVDISTLEKSDKKDVSFSYMLKDGIGAEDLYTIHSDLATVSVDNELYDEIELPVTVQASPEAASKLVADETKADPKTVKVGIKQGAEADSVTVTLEEKASEGDYKLDKQDGLYIPEDIRTVHVKPVWEK